MNRAPYGLTLTLALLALILAMLAGAFWGTAQLPWDERLRALFRLPDAQPNLQLIVWEWRLPRVLMVAMVGGALALSGVILQALLRNPLADPYLLGLSSGASAAATAAIVWLPAAFVASFGLELLAFLGAMLAFILTLGLAFQPGRGMDKLVLILAGVAISLFFQSVSSFFLHLAEPHVTRNALSFLMGSAAGTRWGDIPPLAIVLPLGFIVVLASAKMLDAVLLGDERAVALGVPLPVLRFGLLSLAALLTGLAVAGAGIVGFVGLVVPHLARMVVGAPHGRLLSIAVLFGMITLVVVDLLSRTLLAPEELPLSVLLALFAAPPFVYILRRVRRGL
ncbi:FecCD family ABC transporter permease [Pelagibacterium lacus]|uniref:Iron ABC transporter permease n=1 Tax=Pelagibacterium lacus TaxID=2282655 RepID=A0A369W4U5_9HYPH|nr:iron ABC transporter permease [Pelagibacterium lacus]RDE09027.1 iron ABC transporter permease [Pelagibacterium lacus]